MKVFACPWLLPSASIQELSLMPNTGSVNLRIKLDLVARPCVVISCSSASPGSPRNSGPTMRISELTA